MSLRRRALPTRRTLLLAALPWVGTGLGLAAGRAQAAPGTVSVAVAANFAAPLARMAEGFTAATGHRLRVSAGATGKFYTQIAAGGAPFEVLLAADDTTPARLVREGHAVAGTAFTYAIGQLVLWSATPGLVDPEGAVLRSARFTRLALANPRLAPYGQAAHQVLQALGLAQTLAPRLVTGDSIAQAYQFTATGNAEIGFVALSQVQQPGQRVPGSLWRVPPALYTALRQDAVLLKAGTGNPAARALLAHLQGPEARALMAAFGYRH
jgi:molybdate transport system substrate-binding protein